MKKILISFSILLIFLSCKPDAPNKASKNLIESKSVKQSDELTLLKGEFIYYSDAAVLQTSKQVYGVIIDKKMAELNDMAMPFKTEITDFVQVEIRGKIIPKPENEDGWEYRVEIKEILSVEALKQIDDTVKLGIE